MDSVIASTRTTCLTEILDEDEEREPKKVVIDASNDLTFRVTRWVADTTMYSATVVNGILTVNGKDVVMGSIVAKNVIKTFPGTVERHVRQFAVPGY